METGNNKTDTSGVGVAIVKGNFTKGLVIEFQSVISTLYCTLKNKNQLIDSSLGIF